VASAPLEIQFDPKLLRLNDVSLGDFFSKDERRPVFTKNIMNDTGAAIIQLNRPPGSHGASRSGTLVTLDFQAVARGTAVVQIPRLAVRNTQGVVISNSTPQLTVSIK
jgi:general secretion pathway protein D